MRKILFFLIICCGVNQCAYAAPCYGTRMPRQKEFFAGAQSHAVFTRYLEDDFGKVRSAQHFMLLSYGVFDWLSIDLKGGAGNIKQRPTTSDEIDYSSGFAGGYGLRIRLTEGAKIKTVFGFQHISVHPQKARLGDTKHRAILDDWQVSLLASYRLAKCTPYAGFKWSRLDYIHKVEDDRKRRMSDLTKSLGCVIGCDIPLSKKVWLNIEGQFGDGAAASCSVNFSF